jgi:hypothetical protein
VALHTIHESLSDQGYSMPKHMQNVHTFRIQTTVYHRLVIR